MMSRRNNAGGDSEESQRRIRELTRKVEELTDDIRLLEEGSFELKSDKSRL